MTRKSGEKKKSELDLHCVYTTWFPFLDKVFGHDLGELELTIDH